MAATETSVTKTGDTAEAGKDLRSAQDIARTSGLDRFKIKPDEVTEAAQEDAIDIGELKLPKTAKETHKLLQEVLAIEPKDNRENKVKLAKLAKVRSHLTTLEDGVATPVISMKSHKEITGAQSANANEMKLVELSKTHPEVKGLLDKCAGLEKQILELKKEA